MMKTNKKRVILCLDGEPPSKKTLLDLMNREDSIVAADGGANWLFSYGALPDVLIGDLDGIQKNVLQQIKRANIIQIKDQYTTDFEKSLSWIIQKKYKKVILLAMAGKRIDHTLTNFSLVWKFSKKIEMEVRNDNWRACFLQNEKKIFQVQKGMTISVVPYSKCTGITLKGMKFPLHNASMQFGGEGISNVAKQNRVEISVKKGRIAVFFLSC